MSAVASIFSGAPTPQTQQVNANNFNLPTYSGSLNQANQIFANSNQTAPTANVVNAQAATLGPAVTQNGVNIDTSGAANANNASNALISQLAQQAQTGGPGSALANQALQTATNSNLAQQAALAQSSNGSNAGLERRQLAENEAMVNQQAIGQGVQNTLAAQLGAQGLLGTTANNVTGQANTLATNQAGLTAQINSANQNALNAFLAQNAQNQQQAALQNAQLGTQTNIQNAGNVLQQQGLNQQGQLGAVQLVNQIGQAQQQGTENLNTAQQNAINAGNQAQLAQYNANTAIGGGILKAVGGGLSGGLTSDETAKEDIKPADDDIQTFLDSIVPSKYKYKNNVDAADGGKSHIGIVAQDVEKTAIGKGMIGMGADGKKTVHFGPEQFAQLFAAMGNIHHRLKKAGV